MRRKDITSGCQGSRYTAMDPGRLPPPWSTYLAVDSKTLSMGTSPLLVPPVDRMPLPRVRTLLTDSPMPPLLLLTIAHSLSVS